MRREHHPWTGCFRETCSLPAMWEEEGGSRREQQRVRP